MKWLDLPPFWLLGCLFVTWPIPVRAAWAHWPWLGTLTLVIAAALVGAALFEFRRARTTPIPHLTPSALISNGIFRWTRNPIYLADLLILFGLSVIWAKPLGLLLVPVLWLILERRFILAEEARLQAEFPEGFAVYAGTVRRWL
ncbi:MAG: methyltransferase [Pseudomonadota bacterium]